jgi:hypothetical protein
MAFISCGMFGYSLNQIGSIIQEYSKKQEEYRQKLQELNLYLKEREVPNDIYGRAKV